MIERQSATGVRLLAIVSLLWIAVPSLSAADQRPGPPTGNSANPSISLNAYGQSKWIQDAREPLLLMVSLANPEAARIDAANRDALVKREAYRRSGVLDMMPEKDVEELKKEFIARPIPTFGIGSKSKPPGSLIRWVTTDGTGKPVQLKVRQLSSGSSDPVLLDGRSGSRLYFGVDPEVLAGLPEGDCRIRAVLDTTNEKDMWSGKIESPPVNVTISKRLDGLSSKDALMRDYLYGRYYLLDAQYGKVEPYAARLLAADPKSITAWELRGDAMAGMGDRGRAEAAFRQALANFDARYARTPGSEPPEYLVRRYNDIRAGRP
jgi:hypothetical protein